MDFGTIVPQFGGLLWTVVFFAVALSVIVAIHELGHYLVGRWCGIGAEVFSVGFGPVLWARRDRRGTQWQIAALPLGGYVKFLGDADAASRPDAAAVAALDPAARRHTMTGAPLLARAATVAAGPLANFLLAAVIFAGVIGAQGEARYPLTVASVAAMPADTAGGPAEGGTAGPEGLRPGDVLLAIDGRDVTTPEAAGQALAEAGTAARLTYTVERDGQRREITAPGLFPALVGAVMPRSAADGAGLRAGDVILTVNGQPVATFDALAAQTAASEGHPLLLDVWRAGQVRTVSLVPKATDLPLPGGGFERRYLIGLTAGLPFTSETRFPGVMTALGQGAARTWDVIATTVSGVAHMITGDISACNIQGPIGIAEASGSMASAGTASFLQFIAFLSAAIGLMNLIPIPVLDGGHLVFHLWEAVTRRPPDPRAVQVLMTVGLIAVVALMAFGLVNDVTC